MPSTGAPSPNTSVSSVLPYAVVNMRRHGSVPGRAWGSAERSAWFAAATRGSQSFRSTRSSTYPLTASVTADSARLAAQSAAPAPYDAPVTVSMSMAASATRDRVSRRAVPAS